MTLNWQRFKSLSGRDTDNFENLCRGIIRRHFSAYGTWHELKNQPGVEFYINILKPHPRLGEVDDMVGWQCKWFINKENGELKAAAKDQILHSLDTTREHVPNISFWNLWTRVALAKKDQEWFFNLQENYLFKLELWNDKDLDDLLSGPALDLRNTYFGELALTPEILAEQHEKSLAPIKKRWFSIGHQRTQTETEIRQLLWEPSAWSDLQNTKQNLDKSVNKISSIAHEYTSPLDAPSLDSFLEHCKNHIELCEKFNQPLDLSILETIETLTSKNNCQLLSSVYLLLRKLRSQNSTLSLYLTNVLAFLKATKMLLSDAHEKLSQQFIAVVADAGGGKTQLAIELTSANTNKPAGLLILGRDLHKSNDLNHLAKKYIFYGKPTESFENLVAALDSAATRSNCRLPIVIDGLNEAEDPKRWKPLLETALITLKKYPKVVLICTLRTGENRNNWQNDQTFRHYQIEQNREQIVHEMLPEQTQPLYLDGFEGEIIHAIHAYFKHYKIQADPYMAPVDFFQHPLNLRIFCDVTNPQAKQEVCIRHFPSSIVSLFQKIIDHAAENISNNKATLYSSEYVQKVIYLFGQSLWEERKRFVTEKNLLDKLQLPCSAWDTNIINLLVQEGLLFRDEMHNEPFTYILSSAYDRLGGFFIANYLLKLNKYNRPEEWIDQQLIEKLFGSLGLQHELAEDIIYALVTLTPRYTREQLWQIIPKRKKKQILSLSYLIERENFDKQTLEAYTTYVINSLENNSHQIFQDLNNLSTVVDHPLNSQFLDSILKDLSMADRDLYWTEYVRTQISLFTKKIQNLINYWQHGNSLQTESIEYLRALKIRWYLTSTNIEFRELVTKALMYYGLRFPENLFQLTINSLEINDPYVPERMLAVSYSVVTMHLLDKGTCTEIENFAYELYEKMFSQTAPHSTTHILARNYAASIIQRVAEYNPLKLNNEVVSAATHPFPEMPRMNWEEIIKDDASHTSPMLMDFRNYTIGRLISGRRNYDFKHPEYRELHNKILWRIKQLGWNYERFNLKEKEIARSYEWGHNRGERAKVERYGKKYSWIAYYEMAGQREDDNKLKDDWSRNFTIDIDPFFPNCTETTIKTEFEYLDLHINSTEQWLRNENAPDFSSLLIKSKTNKDKTIDEYVCLDSFISEMSQQYGRHFYVGVQSYLIKENDLDILQDKIKSDGIHSIDFPDSPDFYNDYVADLYWDSFYLSLTNQNINFENIDLTEQLIDTYLTTINYIDEKSSIEGQNFRQVLLSPDLYKLLDLKFKPIDLTYKNQLIKDASWTIKQRNNISGSYESFYIRKDLILKLLDKNKLKLVWIIKTERSMILPEIRIENPYKGFYFFKIF